MDNRSADNLVAAIEAILFIYGEPIKIKKIAELLEVEEKNVRDGLLVFSEKLKADDRGLNLLVAENKATLVTKPDLQRAVNKIVKEEMDANLTPAALETLAIVAYLGPVSRREIDYIRGVNSVFSLRNLAVKGLVWKEPSKEAPGDYLYGATFDFLKHIGLNSVAELPDLNKFKDIMKNFSSKNEIQSETK